MKLLVCDLDGTLTRTNAVDEECFVQAFADVFSIHNVNTKWAEYDHVTDLGVLQQVFRDRFRRLPERNEITSFADCFVTLLRDRYSDNSHSFGEVPGASSLLLNLTNHPMWGVAIATGALEASAKFKLGAAQLPGNDIPAAFSEDGPSRESIVRTAIKRAQEYYSVRQFERVISMGDALWDIRTARRLELPFVGVGHGQRAAFLRDNGATTVIENFLNYEECLDCIDNAVKPRETFLG